jgi:hypothetical protein
MKTHHAPPRPTRRALSATLAVALAALAGWIATSSTGAAPGARAAKSCKPPAYPGSGYFTSLKVSRTSCKTGRKVTLSHYHCRVRHGVSGRCGHKVRNFTCTEFRNAIPTQIDARVTCRRGSAKVVYTYQQNR